MSAGGAGGLLPRGLTPAGVQPLQRLAEAIERDGLQQVVDRAQLEGAEGVLLVGRHEHHGGRLVELVDQVHQLEAR